MAKAKKQTKKPASQAPQPSPIQAPPSPKESARQAIALCHDLIARSSFTIERFEHVKAALAYLENLFKQVSETPDVPATDSAPSPAPVEPIAPIAEVQSE